MPAWMRNAKTGSDWKNAKTGDVVLEAGGKITVRGLRKLEEEGVKNIAFAAGRADRPLLARSTWSIRKPAKSMSRPATN